MRFAAIPMILVGILALAVAVPQASEVVAVVDWSIDGEDLIVTLEHDAGLQGTITVRAEVDLPDGSTQVLGIDMSTNGHDQGRRHGPVELDDLDRSRPDVCDVTITQPAGLSIVDARNVRASFSSQK